MEPLVISFAITAAIGDVRWRKIPRAFTTAGLLVGLAFHLYRAGFQHAGWADVGSSALACFIGFAAGLALFQLGAIGGGDVKLITALGAMLGLNRWLFAMEVAILAAAALAIIQALRRGVLRQTVANMVDLIRWIFAHGAKAHPVVNVSNAAMMRAPFGVAAALGTVLAVIRP